MAMLFKLKSGVHALFRLKIGCSHTSELARALPRLTAEAYEYDGHHGGVHDSHADKKGGQDNGWESPRATTTATRPNTGDHAGNHSIQSNTFLMGLTTSASGSSLTSSPNSSPKAGATHAGLSMLGAPGGGDESSKGGHNSNGAEMLGSRLGCLGGGRVHT